MLQRWLVAIVGLPLLLAVLLACPAWATMLLVCGIASIAAYELLSVAGKGAKVTERVVTALFAALQVFAVYAYKTGMVDAAGLFFAPLLLTVLLFLTAVATFEKPGALPFSTVSAGVVGGAVFPTMYACIVLLRMQDYGRLYVLAPFFVAFAGDTLAMYCGKWFGKKKLTPVSPKKTWAGFYGSVLGSVLGMALFGFLGVRWMGYAPNWVTLALLGVVGNLAGQLGDLSTSLIKREAGVKDYSHLFLTHGGMLDRFDSTLFIAPVVYYFVSAGLI